MKSLNQEETQYWNHDIQLDEYVTERPARSANI
jgi:hypothetical protein